MKTLKEKVEYLKIFVTDDKNELFDRLIADRTDYITIVLEDLFQSHNQSAVMRSADCFGVQDVHLIENKNMYDDSSTVSRGAREWLSLYRYNEQENNTPDAIETLRAQGYRIIGTTPHEDGVSVDQLDLGRGKMAFFFGTELTGLSEIAAGQADEFVKIPMVGFTESLNVSVCAAIVMYTVTQRLRQSNVNWQLSDEKRDEVLLQWYHKSIRASDAILERFNADEFND